jgi:hypothetical protein
MAAVGLRGRQAVDGAGEPRAVAEKRLYGDREEAAGSVYSVGAEGPALTFAKRLVPRREVERLVV